MQLGNRGKIVVISVAMIVAGLIAGAYFLVQIRASQEAHVEARLSDQARTISTLLGGQATPWTPAQIDPWATQLSETMTVDVTVLGPDGRLLGDSTRPLTAVLTAEPTDLDPAQIPGRPQTCLFTRDDRALYCTMALTDRRGFIQVSTALSGVDSPLVQLEGELVFAGLPALALALFVSFLAWFIFDDNPTATLSSEARAKAKAEAKALGSIHKVSEQLEWTVNELAAERNLFETVLEAMNEAVLAVDRDREVIAINGAAQDLLGLNPEIRGHQLLDSVALPELSTLIDAALDGESRNISAELDRAGDVRNLMVRATPRNEGGGAVLVLHDVTEIRRLENVRRDFVANVSHELRTPVSVIQANTETLLAGAIEQPVMAARFLDAINRNALRLGQLITDLLDISRIEAGKYELDIRLFPLDEVATSVHAAVGGACRRRSAELTLDIDPTLLVRADAGALEQVLVNLVENAVKYGPEGGLIELVAIPEAEELRIEVRDRGPGISDSQRGRVFERFYRIDPGRSRHMGGTGLGLAIVKNLSEAMGGTVGVEPREGGGSVFWVRLEAETRA